MPNKFFAFLEGAAEKVAHVVVEIPSAAVTLEKILVDGQSMEPAVKAGLVTLIRDGEALSLTLASVAATKGANWVSDAAAVAQVEGFVKDFISFLPTLESAGSKLAADVK